MPIPKITDPMMIDDFRRVSKSKGKHPSVYASFFIQKKPLWSESNGISEQQEAGSVSLWNIFFQSSGDSIPQHFN